MYQGGNNARKDFANPHFYSGNKIVADMFKAKREDVIGKGTTVRELRHAYEKKKSWKMQLASEISAHALSVEEYFDHKSASIEQLLAEEDIVALNAKWELDLYVKRGAISMDTLDSTHYEYQNRNPGASGGGRDMPLGVVTGSSGSGKTFFCLKYMAGFLWGEQEHAAARYLRPDPDVTKVSFGSRRPVGEICKDLVVYLRTGFEAKFRRKFSLEVTERLNMHACVNFDEAGATDLCGRFEDKAFLLELCLHLQLHLAVSVAVVVAGTGITERNLTSDGDAYIFRLKPWAPTDVRMLLEQREIDLFRKDGDTLETVVDTIFGHAKLRGLTTNARCAFLLRQAIFSLCSSHVADSWTVQLDAWAPALVTTVVSGYMADNGIQGLGFDERRVVAASVFRALEDAASWGPDSGAVVFYQPSFGGLLGRP